MSKYIKLNHTLKSYSIMFLIGILIGCICRLLDYCPSGYWWSFTSMQTLLGFWIITNTIIVLLSTSNKCAGISSCLYMLGMDIAFYGLYVLLNLSNPNVSFLGSIFDTVPIMWALLSIPCGIAAFILYYWNKNNKLSAILYSLPVGALISEVIATIIYLLQYNTITFLDQLIMDIVGFVVFSMLFYKRVKNKKLYIVSILFSPLFFYLIFFLGRI